MSEHGTICVLGSANVDHVLRVARFPHPGETITAGARTRTPGGKGLNQAIAAARAGARTFMQARVGMDADASLLRQAADDAGICAQGMKSVGGPTGSAEVLIDEAGENVIIVSPGANAAFETLSEHDREAIAAAHVLLLQGEVPQRVLVEASREARQARTTVVLTPAPVTDFDSELMSKVDVLVPNEHEASALAGNSDPLAAAQQLAVGVGAVVVTLGGRGSAVVRQGEPPVRIEPLRVHAVDTTGAGDAFAGTFAARLAGGASLTEAARWATAAGALAVTRRGASSAPSHEDVESLLSEAPVK